MVKPKPIIETEVRAQDSNVRTFERSLRIQESCVEIKLRLLPEALLDAPAAEPASGVSSIFVSSTRCGG
jgi:hypothetical protein